YEPATSGAETPREYGRRIPLEDDDSYPHRGDVAEDTIPSDAFGYDSAGDATVPGAAYTDETVSGPTVQAQPGGYGTIEQPLEGGYDIPEEEAFATPEYRRAVEQQRQSWARTGVLLAAVGTGILLLGAAGYIALALLWYQGIVSDLETGIVALGSFEPEFQNVTILDTNGEEIATLGRDGDDRRPVSLEEVSPYMIHAIIALEDSRFYEDSGWDLMTTLGAFGQNLVSGEIGSRSSNITRQVARDLVLQNPEDTPERRRDEIVVAGELTRRYSKNEILTLYLNEVAFFGNQTYGVEAAARFYFNKAARDLTFPEAAMLAAVVQSPDTNEPVNNRGTALALKDVVMERMAEVGCLNFQHDPPTGSRRFCISTDDLTSPLTVRDKARVEAREYEARQFTMRYPHFISLVQNQIEAAYGTTEVYRRGFIVRTTLNPRVQNFAEEALRAQLGQTRANGVNNGSIMVTDPRTGAIVALVGSPDFDDTEIAGQIDYGRSYQRPGGTVIPLVYAAALAGFEQSDGGDYYTPATIVWDVPTNYRNGQPVVNYDQQHRGAVNVRSALQNSLNVPAVRTYDTIGTAHFRTMGEALGLRFRSDEQFGPPTAPNETEVRLYDLMKAYGAIANDGVRLDLHTIDSITDADGNPVAVPAREDPVQALTEAQAYLMVNMLSDDQARSGQFGVNSALTIQGLPTQNVVGAVAGTNASGNGLWTIGFTNNRVVGVWLGTADGSPARGGLTGFTAAAPLWNQVMRASLANNAPRQFVQPDSVSPVQICADTGAIPTQICANVRSELFAANQPPPPASEGFSAPARIDSWTGLLANEFCPDNIVEDQFVTIQDSAVISWLNNQGQAYARRVGLTLPVSPMPERACDQSTPIPVARISNPSGGQTVM
ncbi:MAG: transglycosylase domain-containing protein, partial [Phototrophicaceae bacterium]